MCMNLPDLGWFLLELRMLMCILGIQRAGYGVSGCGGSRHGARGADGAGGGDTSWVRRDGFISR